MPTWGCGLKGLEGCCHAHHSLRPLQARAYVSVTHQSSDRADKGHLTLSHGRAFPAANFRFGALVTTLSGTGALVKATEVAIGDQSFGNACLPSGVRAAGRKAGTQHLAPVR